MSHNGLYAMYAAVSTRKMFCYNITGGDLKNKWIVHGGKGRFYYNRDVGLCKM